MITSKRPLVKGLSFHPLQGNTIVYPVHCKLHPLMAAVLTLCIHVHTGVRGRYTISKEDHFKLRFIRSISVLSRLQWPRPQKLSSHWLSFRDLNRFQPNVKVKDKAKAILKSPHGADARVGGHGVNAAIFHFLMVFNHYLHLWHSN